MNIDKKLLHSDDRSLICLIQKGSHDAFKALVYRHSKRFYRIAYRLVSDKDEAEDIVQEAFLKLWTRPEIWDSNKRSKFTTWFYKVIINQCFDRNRRKKTLGVPESMEVFADTNPGQDLLLDDYQKKSILERFICDLPKRQQLAINLCFYEGLSNNEAAEIIGVKLKALQSLIMRAKTTLKVRVKKYL